MFKKWILMLLFPCMLLEEGIYSSKDLVIITSFGEVNAAQGLICSIDDEVFVSTDLMRECLPQSNIRFQGDTAIIQSRANTIVFEPRNPEILIQTPFGERRVRTRSKRCVIIKDNKRFISQDALREIWLVSVGEKVSPNVFFDALPTHVNVNRTVYVITDSVDEALVFTDDEIAAYSNNGFPLYMRNDLLYGVNEKVYLYQAQPSTGIGTYK